MEKPVIADLPYPDIEDLTVDCRSARIIAPAYAGMHGELNAILGYVYHHFNFLGQGMEEISIKLVGISVAEMVHLNILGKMLVKLGSDPVFTRIPPYKCDFYTSACVSYAKNPKKMIMDDISGELIAIEEYKKITTQLCNESVSAVISRIIIDEELHVKVLKNILLSL